MTFLWLRLNRRAFSWWPRVCSLSGLLSGASASHTPVTRQPQVDFKPPPPEVTSVPLHNPNHSVASRMVYPTLELPEKVNSWTEWTENRSEYCPVRGRTLIWSDPKSAHFDLPR